MKNNSNFSFETTLATKSFLRTIERAKSKGYYVTLIFFWLDSTELAKDRVKKRVLEGGHNIKSDVIERRYKTGIKNLFKFYKNKVDYLMIYDNSTIESHLIAEKEISSNFVVYNNTKFDILNKLSNE